MGEHILKIALAELATVRIQCRKCGVVLEMPFASLGRVASECSCGNKFIRSGEQPQHANARLSRLKEAVDQVLSMDDAYGLEFVIKFPPSGE